MSSQVLCIALYFNNHNQLLTYCGWKPAIEQSSGKMHKLTVAVGLVKMEMSLQSTKEIKVLTFLFKVHLYQKVNTPIRQCKYKLMCLFASDYPCFSKIHCLFPVAQHIYSISCVHRVHSQTL